MRRLERELGVELFDRTTRNVALTVAGNAFLPLARAIVEAETAALVAMASISARQASLLRIGTNVGLGSRLDRVLGALPPALAVELVSVAPVARLQQVRDGELDAAFVRGLTHSSGLELIPVWRDELVVALPAHHPLAAGAAVNLGDLAPLPLRIAPRAANPHLVDLVVDACRSAGFEPVLGPAFTTDQDTLAAIATGQPSWTVFYASQAEILPTSRTAFRPLTPPVPAMQTYLAVRPTTPAKRLADLLAACHAAADESMSLRHLGGAGDGRWRGRTL